MDQIVTTVGCRKSTVKGNQGIEILYLADDAGFLIRSEWTLNIYFKYNGKKTLKRC